MALRGAGAGAGMKLSLLLPPTPEAAKLQTAKYSTTGVGRIIRAKANADVSHTLRPYKEVSHEMNMTVHGDCNRGDSQIG